MSKYRPLYSYLKLLSAQGMASWNATFNQVEEVLGFKLPRSAEKFPAWWANEEGNKNHVQCHAWLEAGWKSEDLNLTGHKITFRKVT